MGKGTPARYRRVIDEYVEAIVESLKAPVAITMENRLRELLHDYCIEYASSFVHSTEGNKAENQWKYVWTVAMLDVTDMLMMYHGRKLETIVSQLNYILTSNVHDFIDWYTMIHGRRPTVTEIRMYKEYVTMVLNRLTIGDIAELFKISVTTARRYIANLRDPINMVIQEHYVESPELSRIYETCVRCNIPNILFVPRGMFGTRFWNDVDKLRLRTIWHVIGLRCRLGTVGTICDSWNTDLCFMYFYMVTGYSLLNSCYRDNWQLLDICHTNAVIETQRVYRYMCPIPETVIALVTTFTDWYEYYTLVPSRDRILVRYMNLIRGVYTMAKRVLNEKYMRHMRHKCLEE